MVCAALAPVVQVPAPDMTEQAARAHLGPLVQAQQSDMIHYRLQELARLYTSSPAAQHALKVAEVRSQYFHNWAEMRGIQWTGIRVTIKTPRVSWISPTRIRFSVWEREQYQYHYRNLQEKPLAFGIAARHQMSIVKEHGTWLYATDDFVNPVLPDEMAGQHLPRQGGKPPQFDLSRQREAAVE